MFRFISWFLPESTAAKLADKNHPHGRRLQARYKKKQGIVKNIWIGSGVVMLCAPTPAFIVSLALATTFLAFVVLDETL